MGMGIKELSDMVSELVGKIRSMADELWTVRSLVVGSIVSISRDYTSAKVKLNNNQTTVTAQLSKHPNEWNIVGHLRVGENVLVSVQKNNFDALIISRIHDKTKTFPEYDCHKNNDTNPWATYTA